MHSDGKKRRSFLTLFFAAGDLRRYISEYIMPRNSILEKAKSLERELSLKEGFLIKLKDEDDWSFIIKLHAFIEAAVSHLLSKALGQDKLLGIFTRLELGNKQTGKIAFIKALDLLEKTDRRFIDELSKLRNEIVHNVSKVSFDLIEYVNNLNPEKFDKFVKSFTTFFIPRNPNLNIEQELFVRDLFKEHPKFAIWESAVTTVGLIYGAQRIAQADLRLGILEEIKQFTTDER